MASFRNQCDGEGVSNRSEEEGICGDQGKRDFCCQRFIVSPMAKPQLSSSASPSRSPSVGLRRMDELEKVFARFDADADGRISASELASVLRALGSDPSPEEIRDMISEMDTDRDGFVDFQEFAAFHLDVSRGSAEAELRDAFRMYDLDNDGRISAAELHRVLSSLGEKCSVADCTRMIRSVDSDGDGSVNFEEFRKMMGGGGRSDGEGKPTGVQGDLSTRD